MLHGLLHLAETGAPATSQELARAMQSHPVAVRRELGRLRDRGLVRSVKGHGGGWSLDLDLDAVTLLDVYEALGSPPLFAMRNKNERPECLMEQAVNASLDATFREAELLLLETMGRVTLASLVDDFHQRFESLGLGRFDATRTPPRGSGAADAGDDSKPERRDS